MMYDIFSGMAGPQKGLILQYPQVGARHIYATLVP